MEEDKQETIPPRGNEWEVVSLTASTYAAAPSSETNDSTNENIDNEPSKEELGSSQMMSKSEFEHLVFPPSEHEDLPVESDNSEDNQQEPVQKLEIGKHDVDEDDKIQEQLNEPSLAGSDELESSKFSDKGKTLSLQKIEFEEDPQGLEVKNSVYQGHGLNPGSSESIIAETVLLDQDTKAPNTNKFSVENSDLPSDFPENVKENNCSGPLCEDWWKKQAASLYARTKEADVYWSIFIAASIVGIVFIGKKWRSGGFSNVDKTRSWFLSFVCST